MRVVNATNTSEKALWMQTTKSGPVSTDDGDTCGGRGVYKVVAGDGFEPSIRMDTQGILIIQPLMTHLNGFDRGKHYNLCDDLKSMANLHKDLRGKSPHSVPRF
jgi:hypothetical protein